MLAERQANVVFLKSARASTAVIILLFTVISSTAAGCSGGVPGAEKTTIFTGGTAGTYYPLGEALAGIINKKVRGVEASARSSGGSVANARAIGTREAGLALIQNDIADYAYKGTEMFAGGRVQNIRGIASWYPEFLQFVTLKDSGIRTIRDLKGKRVGIGAPGSGVFVEAMAILNAAGIDRQNTTLLELDFAEVAAGLQRKAIDAGCIVAGIPTPAVADVANSREVSILEIPDDIYDGVKRQHAFFVRQTIPAGTYKGLSFSVNSAGLMAMLATRADMPEETVYGITRAMFESLDVLAAANVSAKHIALNKALEGVSIPLHPGAERYYREAGLIK